MRALKLLLLLSLLVSYSAKAQRVNTENGYSVDVVFYTENSVRITKTPIGQDYHKTSLSVIGEPLAKQPSAVKKGDFVIFKTTQIQVKVDTKMGMVQFTNSKNSNLLVENAFSMKLRGEGVDKDSYRVSTRFTLDKEEAIYGLGIMQEGLMSLRGLDRKNMIQGNTDDYVNIIHSIKAWGLFWDNYSPTSFLDNETGMQFSSEVGDVIDYYFMYGGNADGVIAQIRELTGSVPMQALWAYGFMQSKERYKSSKELLEVLHTYRDKHIPLDVMIQDWQYWGNNYLWNAMEFNSPDFPNAQRTVDEIHKLNAKMTISIWASFGPQTKQYKELKEKNLLFDFETWPQSGLSDWPPRMDYPSGVRVYDAFSPEARDIYWKHLTRLHDMKIDGWWMDSTEPDRNNFRDEHMERITGLGSYRSVINAFPLMSVGGVYDKQRATSNDKRVFILTRSAFAGQQRYGANTWSGDTWTSWNTLRAQIPAGLHFALTGNPNFNADIGGFFADKYNDRNVDGTATQNPLFQELYVRWMQYGAFSPMMRSHGTEVPREVYLYGKEGDSIYDALVEAIHLRYDLLPYIYSTAWDVTNNNGTFQRALMMDFASDKNTWDMNNEFMFGRSLLFAPIVKAQYTNEIDVKRASLEGTTINWEASHKHEVYLPAGTSWYDYSTGKGYKGGQTITIPTTIHSIPVFAKAGSIIPVGPKDIEFSTEKAWDKLTIKVYEGANGHFSLYEDEFDSYNYENGAYSTIDFDWNNAAQKLSIATRKGSYNGMINERNFTIILYRFDGTQIQKHIEYKGNKAEIKF